MKLALILILLITFSPSQTLIASEAVLYELYLKNANLPLETLFPGLHLSDASSAAANAEKNPTGEYLTKMDTFSGLGISANYETETIIFNCRMLMSYEEKELTQLYEVFRSFGYYIGGNNAARWVGDERTRNFDLSQGKALCDSFRFDYNGGPYVVHYRILRFSSVMDQAGNLEAIHLTTDFSKIDLARFAPASRYKLLNRLEQAIRRKEAVAPVLLYERNKRALADFFKGHYQGILELGKTIFEIGVMKKA
jgi:hypothetical protein